MKRRRTSEVNMILLRPTQVRSGLRIGMSHINTRIQAVQGGVSPPHYPAPCLLGFISLQTPFEKDSPNSLQRATVSIVCLQSNVLIWKQPSVSVNSG
jgi:hypothetical protein